MEKVSNKIKTKRDITLSSIYKIMVNGGILTKKGYKTKVITITLSLPYVVVNALKYKIYAININNITIYNYIIYNII